MGSVLRDFDLVITRNKYNIAPTDAVTVAAQEEGEKFVREMRWWLTPALAPEVSTEYSMFNAKSETIETSRAYTGPVLNTPKQFDLWLDSTAGIRDIKGKR